MNINIEAERVRNQFTMASLSDKLGICAKTYSKYVKGDVPIPSNVLIDMAKLFGCSIDYLLGFDSEQNRREHLHEK